MRFYLFDFIYYLYYIMFRGCEVMADRAKYYGEQVTFIRNRKKMSRPEFAKLLNMTPMALGNIENGITKKPSEEIVKKLAKIDYCSYNDMYNRIYYGSESGPQTPEYLDNNFLREKIISYPAFNSITNEQMDNLIQSTLNRYSNAQALIGVYRRKERGNWTYDYKSELTANLEIQLSVHYFDRKNIRAFCSWDLLQYQYDYLIYSKRDVRDIKNILGTTLLTLSKININIRSFVILFDSRIKDNVEIYEFLKKENFYTHQPYLILRLVKANEMKDEVSECKRKD